MDKAVYAVLVGMTSRQVIIKSQECETSFFYEILLIFMTIFNLLEITIVSLTSKILFVAFAHFLILLDIELF